MTGIERFVSESGLDIKEYDAYCYGYPESADIILGWLLSGDKPRPPGSNASTSSQTRNFPKPAATPSSSTAMRGRAA